jgi:hypothetical protein
MLKNTRFLQSTKNNQEANIFYGFRWNSRHQQLHAIAYRNQNALRRERNQRLEKAPDGILARIPRVLVLMETPVGILLKRPLVEIYF